LTPLIGLLYQPLLINKHGWDDSWQKTTQEFGAIRATMGGGSIQLNTYLEQHMNIEHSVKHMAAMPSEFSKVVVSQE
jgi:hypothetical protein